jgi:two-component system, chemotaxis family, protein-glutamate methylesterase/glutaminase
VGIDQSTRRDIVVVGASAGGVEALMRFVETFPEDLPAAVFVVLHVSPSGSVLPAILSRHSPVQARHAEDGEEVVQGRIYVAPPNRHMLLEDGKVRVTTGPRQNGHRPAIDPLFRSAAWTYGSRVAGVVLSGVLDDGTLGCAAIAARGGLTLVQDPLDASYDSMPLSAIELDSPSFVAPAAELGRRVVELASVESENGEAGDRAVPMSEALEGNRDRRVDGTISAFTCPECSGTLWEVEEGALVRYRCRVGHSYSGGSMDVAQGTSVEAALWTAMRSLEERAALKRRLAARGATPRMRQRYENDATVAEEHAAVVRQLIDDLTAVTAGDEPIVGGAT